MIRMRSLFLYIVTLVAVVLAGCSKDSVDGGVVDPTDGSVSFMTSIDSYVTRSGGKTTWSDGDQIYIASELTNELSQNNLEFVIYDASDTGVSAAGEDKIYYIDGQSNSYFAIYPLGTITDDYYVVDLTDQTSTTTDILYATTTVESQSSGSIALNFSHKVTMVEFTIASGSYDLSSATATLRGAYSKGLFNLKLGRYDSFGTSDIDLKIESVDGGYQIEVSMLPWQNTLELELVIDNGVNVYIFKPKFLDENGDVLVLEAGTCYKYNI